MNDNTVRQLSDFLRFALITYSDYTERISNIHTTHKIFDNSFIFIYLCDLPNVNSIMFRMLLEVIEKLEREVSIHTMFVFSTIDMTTFHCMRSVMFC